MNTEQMKMDIAYGEVVAEFGTQTKAKMYEFIDANGIIIKDRKNKTKEDIYKAIAGFKVQRVEAVAPIAKEEEESESEEEESDDDVPVAQLIKRKEEVMRRPKEEDSDSDSDIDSDYAPCTECENPDCCGECEMETNGQWFSNNCTVAFLERQIKFHKGTIDLMEKRIAVLKAEKKRKARAKKNQVPLRPTYNLKGTNGFGENYTLFRHYRPKVGFCKYAVYNDTANHYVECEFNGKTISDCGTIHKTLNAWTTSNWREQRAKDNEPKKTVKNNAYKETDFMPLVMIDEEEMIYGVEGEVTWKSSMLITDNESKLKVQLEANGKKKPIVKYVKA